MKTRQRLQQIDKMITQPYEHIWDCCCDHGLLGYLLLRRDAARTVHFVDVVEPLIAKVQSKLQRYFTNGFPQYAWQVHCTDVTKLQLSAAVLAKADSVHLVIIAGVGGDLLIELVEGLLKANPTQKMEFLLCPVLHNYKVRAALVGLRFGLINEHLVCENNRFYEILHVATDAEQPISLTGSVMWDLSRKEDQAYLERTISHYHRMVQNYNTSLALDKKDLFDHFCLIFMKMTIEWLFHALINDLWFN